MTGTLHLGPRRPDTTAPPWTTRLRHCGPTSALGLAGVLLTATGLSGVGDAPAPNDTAASMAAHFRAAEAAITATAPMGLVGAVAVGAFVLALARRLHRISQPGPALAVAAGGCLAACYLASLQIVYVALASEIAAEDAGATKGLFVLTIAATPAFGLATAMTLAAGARGARRGRLLPTWWSATTNAGAAIAAVSVLSYANSGFFSPDVQQHVVGNILLFWVLLTAGALAATSSPTEATNSERPTPMTPDTQPTP